MDEGERERVNVKERILMKGGGERGGRKMRK